MRTYSKAFVKQLAHGDKAAQHQLFHEMYAGMFRVCQRYVVQTDEAEDCLMKGFLKIFQQVEKFEYTGEEQFFWWMRRVMVNECLMVIRKKHNFLMMADEDLPETPVEADVLSRLSMEDLQQVIMKLSPGYRTVFSLFVVEGYEHKEIAAMLQISESTSKTQLAKARARLRQLLTQMDYSYGKAAR